MDKAYTFTVNGLVYEIVEVPNGKQVFYNEDGETRIGLTSYIEQRIYLLDSQSKERKMKTLRHELTHVFIEAHAVYRDSYDNESVCDIVGMFCEKINEIANDYFKKTEQQVYRTV